MNTKCDGCILKPLNAKIEPTFRITLSWHSLAITGSPYRVVIGISMNNFFHITRIEVTIKDDLSLRMMKFKCIFMGWKKLRLVHMDLFV
jgi:hypothetical protein